VGDVVGERGRAHAAVGTVGVPPHRHRLAGAGRDGIDDRSDVLELALDGVDGGVAAGAPAAAVHGEGSQAVAELGNEGDVGGVVVQRAVHEQQRRTFAVDPHGDRSPVGGPDVEAVSLDAGRVSRAPLT